MPKLNTTIDNLELKSNRVFSTYPGDAWAAWTDEQYPSAKTLYSAYTYAILNAHPVESVLITTKQTNPGETLGGAWVLIDKEFTNKTITTKADLITDQNATVGTSGNSLMLADHVVSYRLNITTSKELSNPTAGQVGHALVKLKLAACGLSALPYALYGEIVSTDGEYTMKYKIDTDGTVRLRSILKSDGTTKVPASVSFYLAFTLPVSHSSISEALCDKFYWRRYA